MRPAGRVAGGLLDELVRHLCTGVPPEAIIVPTSTTPPFDVTSWSRGTPTVALPGRRLDAGRPWVRPDCLDVDGFSTRLGLERTRGLVRWLRAMGADPVRVLLADAGRLESVQLLHAGGRA